MPPRRSLALGATFGLHRLTDPDLFLQVAVGRTILRDPSRLGIGTFVERYPDYPYVEDKWLASVVAALADAVAGAHGLMVYQIVLMGAQAAEPVGRAVAHLPRLEEAVARHPRERRLVDHLVRALGERANALLGRGALVEAERDLRAMLALVPDACGPYVDLAKTAALAGDRSRAAGMLAEAERRQGAAVCRQAAEADPLLGPLRRADSPPAAR